jgi:phage terminase small subunit
MKPNTPRQVNLRGALTGSSKQPAGPLNNKELLFVEEYLIDLNPVGAARRVGLPPEEGRRLLMQSRVRAAIQVTKDQRSRRTQIYSDEVLRSWELARRVDYNEFVSVIVPPCRYCWGVNHHYQFTTLLEMEKRAVEHFLDQQRLPKSAQQEFDSEGGEGYNVLRQPCRGPEWEEMGYTPNSDHSCPECHGVGSEPRLLVRDTRTLSHGALYLYEGATVGKGGELKINIRSRRDFDEMVGRHLNIFGPNSQSAVTADPTKMTDEQLDQILEAHGVKVDLEYEVTDAVTEDGDQELARESTGEPVDEA